MLKTSIIPTTNSAVMSKRVNVSVTEVEKMLCSKTYKSNISIDMYLSIDDEIKTIPIKIRNMVDDILLWIFISHI